MKSLPPPKINIIPENGVIFNYADQAPAPQKDYCQILVTTEHVIFRWWKISMRANQRQDPKEMKDNYEDFLYNDRAHSEIHRVFGKGMVDYVCNLVKGHFDYLPRLPEDLLHKIILNLDLEDIQSLSKTCGRFRKMSDTNDLWEKIYVGHSSDHHLTQELKLLGESVGWKKLFFTNKLQLQKQLRRQAQQQAGAGDQAMEVM